MSDKSPGGVGPVLGAIGLSPRALLFVAMLTLLVWWFFRNQGMQLGISETAIVILVLALGTAGVRAIWGTFRPRIANPPLAPREPLVRQGAPAPQQPPLPHTPNE